ncbi:Helix-turn-helix domain containing protein OS=Kitasatospora aureofaciens OX=1894 GN=GCM10010502_68750 PE=4 SV=1 [Kitasatospora aureofaciens]
MVRQRGRAGVRPAVRFGRSPPVPLSPEAFGTMIMRPRTAGQKARVRGRHVVGEVGGGMASRAGKQTVKSGAAHRSPTRR